jgi:hypothetical protein
MKHIAMRGVKRGNDAYRMSATTHPGYAALADPPMFVIII